MVFQHGGWARDQQLHTLKNQDVTSRNTNFDISFGITSTMGNGKRICNVQCEESVLVRVTDSCFKRSGEEEIPFIGSTGGGWDRGGTERAEDFSFYL